MPKSSLHLPTLTKIPPTGMSQSGLQAQGVGKSLRDQTKVDFDVKHQTAIVNTPFNPINEECAIIELFGTFCGPCIRLIPTLMQHALKYKNIPILQISAEDLPKLKKFYTGVKTPYSVSKVTPELWEDFSNFFNVRGIPHLVLLRKGVVMFSGHPMDPALEPLMKKLNQEVEEEKKAKVLEAATADDKQ